jgi:hypothetical protein
MEYTVEKSQEEADKIKHIQMILMTLDAEYLESALKDMRENHSMRESMAVMNPNPFTHNEQQDLNAAKQDQIELILKLKKNILNIAKCQGELKKAKGSANEMNKFFGNNF